MNLSYLLLAALVFTASGVRAEPLQQAERILVKPIAGISVGPMKAAAGGRVHRQYPRFGGLQVIALPKGVSVADAVARYRATGLYEYVEPDYRIQTCAVPNDPRFLDGSLWALRNLGQNGGTSNADIHATAAWNVRSSASDVIVAVIDSGLRYSHPDLASNVWTNPSEIPGNGLDDDGNGVIDDVHGFNATAEPGTPVAGDPWDNFGHGTHVAGIIGATGNNRRGIVGVTWRVQLLPCKFIGESGTGLMSDAIECLDYALAHGARIINASWGCQGCFSRALRDAIEAAGRDGAVFVAAAGNSGANVDEVPFYPAANDLENLIAVAATDRRDQLAGFSNYGHESVALAAPGVDILSTFIGSGDDYILLSGTSMAAPHVAGALALMVAQSPKDRPKELIGQLLGTVDPLPNLDGLCLTGGRLNLFQALTGKPRPVARFTASPLGGEPPLKVRFDNRSLNAKKFLWDFGDGSKPSREQKPHHNFKDTGTYTVTLIAWSKHDIADSQTKIVTVAPNYRLLPGNFSWVEPSGMPAFRLYDDDATGAQPLPFAFTFYGQTYSNVFVGSNGLLTFLSPGASLQVPTDLPNPYAPNAVFYPLWSDLDPSARGSVRIGTVGAAPQRVVVVSWAGVPHWNDRDGTFTFQALLYEGRNDIVFQYLDANPNNPTNGAGRTATIGIENANGSIARQFSTAGSTLLTNGQAIAFTMNNEPPPPAPPPLPGTPQMWYADPRATNQINIGWSAVGNADVYIVFRDGDAVAATTNTQYSDIGLPADTTFCYTVTATNRAGSSAQSDGICATTLSLPTFVMDGVADSAGYLRRADGLTLYAALRGQTLYVATKAPDMNDHFFFVATALEPSAYWEAPLSKAGNTAVDPCEPVLGGTVADGRAGWYVGCDTTPDSRFLATMSGGDVLEGTLDLVSLYGVLPDTLYVAAAAYAPGPGGRLVGQTPTGNGDGNLDPDEFLVLPVATLPH